MNTTQLCHILRQDPVIRKRGFETWVIPRDYLVRLKSNSGKPSLIICNTHSHQHEGVHWLLIYVPVIVTPLQPVEFFDSLGQSIHSYHPDFAAWCGPHLLQNHPLTLQHPTSRACGQWCLYVALQRARNRSLKTILAPFRWRGGKTWLLQQDHWVEKLIQKKYGLQLKPLQIACNDQICRALYDE